MYVFYHNKKSQALEESMLRAWVLNSPPQLLCFPCLWPPWNRPSLSFTPARALMEALQPEALFDSPSGSAFIWLHFLESQTDELATDPFLTRHQHIHKSPGPAGIPDPGWPAQQAILQHLANLTLLDSADMKAQGTSSSSGWSELPCAVVSHYGCNELPSV